MIEFIAWLVVLPMVYFWANYERDNYWKGVIESIKATQIAKIEGKKKQVDIAQISEILKIFKDLTLGRIERW